MTRVADVIDFLDKIAPPWMADDGDPIGLHVGDPAAEVRRVCVAVDASLPTVNLAVEKHADMLVVHHPLIYCPLRSLAAGDTVTDRVTRLIRAGIALFVLHTNYDTVLGGINDVLAGRLGLVDTSHLTQRRRDAHYKIAVFTPREAVDAVRDAMSQAGAGRIGLYTHCSFRTPGTGTFLPLPEAQPYVGNTGKLEEVEEYRLEMICAASVLQAVIEAMKSSHPYEEVAYDVYLLANEPAKLGFGRAGTLTEETTLGEFVKRVRETLGAPFAKPSGDLSRPVKRVAVCGGAGSEFYREAVGSGADVYVTGDTKHHEVLDANALGLAVIDAGHFETEKPGMVVLAERLEKESPRLGLEVGYIEDGC